MDSINNKQLVRSFLKVFFKDSEQLRMLCVPSVKLHFRGGLLADGIEELVKFGQQQNKCFPDIEFNVQHVIAERDAAAVRLTQSGHHRHLWNGISAQGYAFEVDEMVFFEIKDHRIVQIWPMLDLELKRAQLT
ncbi:ester cyclase [Echinimonas agarilytica]|uniref:Ester cyclase n=1 Tax=Echinimonas agarilytica TaxID=1215918 RepID=A0AA41W6D1_9GAMM|nr:ester cyclase [Echinimonas agarilytica]MCM2679890.1 ester cyclase [Echinimonas agarilytica]